MTPLILIVFLRAIFERFLIGYLLDTNVALLGLAKPELVSPAIRKAVERGPLYLSVVSYWEVTLKSRKGKLDVGDARAWWMNTLEGFAARSTVSNLFTRMCRLKSSATRTPQYYSPTPRRSSRHHTQSPHTACP